MTEVLSAPRSKETAWEALPGATVGKDVLELLSSSMYIDPLTIYREYVQNAIDSIDEAVEQGIRKPERARITIRIDLATRSIKIRDNGIGVRAENFVTQLGTFGGSLKRGTTRRGFRGVGRLAGLGYCQQLTFRTRAVGDEKVSEMRWDCKKIKRLLRTSEEEWTLEQLLREVVTVRRISDDEPKSFFEVELLGVIRHKSDLLLNRGAIHDYLSETAPVPFHPDFSFASQIEMSLSNRVAMGNVRIYLDDDMEPVYRPYLKGISYGDHLDEFTEIEIHEVPAHDEGTAGVIWLLHHSYKGTIPDKKLRGLRIRCGNVQIGNSEILAEYFPEPRFNAWTVGEIHIFDTRLIPNGRRDHFELGVHFDNLVNHVVPHARKVAVRCRKSSQIRNRLQEFNRLEAMVLENLEVLAQDFISSPYRSNLTNLLVSTCSRLAEISESVFFDQATRESLSRRASSVGARFNQVMPRIPSAFNGISSVKLNSYKLIFTLIYECSENQQAAQSLVDRILAKLAEAN